LLFVCGAACEVLPPLPDQFYRCLTFVLGHITALDRAAAAKASITCRECIVPSNSAPNKH
jgi:hypothetical protein